MPRKRIADKEPVLSPESTAAAPAKAPVTATAPAAKKARAPRASANAVTHRRKKTQDATPVAQTAPVETMPVTAVPVEDRTVAVLPAHDEIAFRAYLIAESRGFSDGGAVADWFEAERQLRAERGL